ncbi:unnamed protein product [Durusdinium trenchii]|uniref:Uncharacterized protein n=1 Tax=Durusdinium trenchii TaxID=1381693 RepID=A0ABP0LQH4_9DINO
MKWTVWTLLSRCTVASFLAIPSVRTEASKQTEAQSPIREFRDPAGRLFRLNLNTGATEWDSNDPTHLKAQGQEPAREGPPRVTVQAGLKEDKADVMEKRTDLFNPQIAGSTKDTQPHASAAVPPRGVTPLQDMPPSRPARMPSASRATKTFSEVVTSGSHPTSGRSQRSKFGFGRGRGLDDWLGWGETADPIAEEVREDLATDLRPSPWQSPGFPQGIPKLGAQSLEAKRHQKADFKHVQKDAGTTAKKLSTEAAHFGRSRPYLRFNSEVRQFAILRPGAGHFLPLKAR